MRIAASGAGSCLAGLTALSFVNPLHNYEAFFGDSYVSKFVRSGVGAVSELVTHGLLESDPAADGALGPAATRTCHAPAKRPHIIMVLDESSFDVSTAPDVRVPEDFARYVVPKGSISIDGISLTVARWRDNIAEVAIIPYTYDHTNIRDRKPGDAVNLEGDIIGKYVERYLEARQNSAPATELTIEQLVKQGF